MYLEHFQLHHQPFSEHAAVAALWQDTRMDEGLARLEYLVEHGTLGLITGASGVGKIRCHDTLLTSYCVDYAMRSTGSHCWDN